MTTCIVCGELGKGSSEVRGMHKVCLDKYRMDLVDLPLTSEEVEQEIDNCIEQEITDCGFEPMAITQDGYWTEFDSFDEVEVTELKINIKVGR